MGARGPTAKPKTATVDVHHILPYVGLKDGQTRIETELKAHRKICKERKE